MLGSFGAMLVLALTKFGGLPHAIEQTRADSPKRTQTRPPEAVAEHLSVCILMLAFALYPHQVYETPIHVDATTGRGSPQPSALSPQPSALSPQPSALSPQPSALSAHQVVRSYAARSEGALRLVSAAMAVQPFITQGLCLLLGWAATPTALAARLPASQADDLLLLVLQAVMRDGAAGYWLAVLLLCALVAALMSTADSGLMAISAMVVNDLVGKRPGRRPLTVAQALWLARGVTVGACVLLVLISTLDVTLVRRGRSKGGVGVLTRPEARTPTLTLTPRSNPTLTTRSSPTLPARLALPPP
jgi:Na+/proline symporter